MVSYLWRLYFVFRYSFLTFIAVAPIIMFQLLLIDKKISEASPLLTQAGFIVDNWQGNQYQKEYLKVFYLFLQV